MNETFGFLSGSSLAKVSRAPMPDGVSPMLATLPLLRFSDQDWILERKLDGEIVAFEGHLTSFSRLQKHMHPEDPLRYVQHRNAEGEEVFREGCRRGREGIIAKHATGPHRHGLHPGTCLAEPGGSPRSSRTDGPRPRSAGGGARSGRLPDDHRSAEKPRHLERRFGVHLRAWMASA